jgi:hypothetical protein
MKKWAGAATKEAREATQRHFALLCAVHEIPEPIFEYHFLKGRRFRFDYCWPKLKVAIDQDGGTWIRGHHANPKQMGVDREKSNLAALHGWRFFRFTPAQIRSGEAIEWIRAAIGGH